MSRAAYRLSAARLITVFAAVLFAWYTGWYLLTILTAVLVFTILVYFHNRSKKKLTDLQKRADYHRQTVARLDDSWIPKTDSAAHSVSRFDDLGIEGRFSLTGFTDRCITNEGSMMLRDLLTGKASTGPDEILKRQAMIRSLQKKRPFRARWFAVTSDKGPLPGFLKLLKHQDEKAGLSTAVFTLLRIAASILCLFTILSWFSFQILDSPAYFLISFPVQIIFLLVYTIYRSGKSSNIAAVILESEPLLRYSELLGLAVKLKTNNQDLQAYVQEFQKVRSATSKLYRIAGIADLKRNPLLHAAMLVLFLYRIHTDAALHSWMQKHAAGASNAIGLLTVLDALLSLSLLSDYRKTCEASLNENRVEARNLRHPLISPSTVHGNDIRILRSDLWIISGSNMSGKSTFLRAVGLNLKLAMAGAPVIADEFSFFPSDLQTSIDAVDNLEDSESLFYAEVKKVKSLVSVCETKKESAFFLIDEMLRGTNAKERSAASVSILSHIMKTKATGIITTHDLAILKLEEMYPDRVATFHFKESSREKLTFDYQIHPGPVEEGNAILILRKEGLPV